jgi:hypothetical protein
LTFSPELTLGSGILVQSEHVFLLFSFKLVLFSSNFFDLDANFFGNHPFLVFGERFLSPQEFSSKKLALSAFWQEGFSSLDLVFCKLHLYLLQTHHRNHRSHLTRFCNFDHNFISPCGITRGYSGDFNWTGGLSRQIDTT